MKSKQFGTIPQSTNELYDTVPSTSGLCHASPVVATYNQPGGTQC